MEGKVVCGILVVGECLVGRALFKRRGIEALVVRGTNVRTVCVQEMKNNERETETECAMT